jgi:hypothetical protein
MKTWTGNGASVICLVLLSCWALRASADEVDDHFKKACSGLSAVFYSSGPKSDPLDEEISKDIDSDKDVAVIVRRAQFIGAAQVCGQDTASALDRLMALAAAKYPKGSAKSKRFVRVVDCSEARAERSAAGHWASPQFCPQAVREFTLYVVREQTPDMR